MKAGRILRGSSNPHHRSQERGKRLYRRVHPALPMWHHRPHHHSFALPHGFFFDDTRIVSLDVANPGGGIRVQRRARGLRWRRRETPENSRSFRRRRRRPGVVAVRPRCAARRTRRGRDAGPQPHRLVDAGRPRAAAPPNGTLLIHYGSPVVTSHNTVLVPVKTVLTGGFRIEARSGVNGGLIWSADTDYVLPPHNWVPSYNLALTTGNRLYAPGAGGKLIVKDDADAAAGAPRSVVFYGAAAYNAAPATFDASVFINTPLTVDAQGNVFFGFVVTGANPAGLVERHRTRRRERHRQLGVGRPARGRRRDRQGRDEQRARALARRPDALRRGEHRACRRRHPVGLPACARQRDAGAEEPGAARRPRRTGRPRASATTRPRRRRSAPTATSTSACSRRPSARTTRAAGCCTSMRRWRLQASRAASAGTRRHRSFPHRWCRRTAARRPTC